MLYTVCSIEKYSNNNSHSIPDYGITHMILYMMLWFSVVRYQYCTLVYYATATRGYSTVWYSVL